MLESMIPKGDPVTHGDGSVDVHALRVVDVCACVQKHGAQMRALFDTLSDEAPGGDALTAQPGDESNVLAAFVGQAPDLVADLITMATREPEAIEAAKQLPVGVQIKILRTAWRLTAMEPEDVGKLLGGLVQAVTQIAAAITIGKPSLKPPPST